ncbi:MAG TPA: dCTP deaminase [Candidatus Acidoferrum sp.]|nr:dCTP deaminase [Candidatus Acidoferrum sp.]
MMLSDKSIREYIKEGKIKVEPFDLEKQLQAVGIDLRLDNVFREFKISHKPFIDLREEHLNIDTNVVTVPEGEIYIIHPGEFVLGVTLESVELPTNIVGRLDGRSSLGRVGIIVHSTAGRVDPGWKGKLTLEISNIGKLPIALIPGMRFCYLMFEEISSTVEKPYKGKYGGKEGSPTVSRINEEFGKKKK